jgi:hypothetical protein
MQHVEPTPEPTTSHLLGVLRRLGLYIFMVLWAAVGIGYTDLYPQRAVYFWQLTTLVFAAIAIARVFLLGGPGRTTLALKQVAHWGAFLVAMLLLHSHTVANLVTGDPLGLVTLMLLALATFLDGVYVDWRFCVVGLVLALGVVVVAFLDNSALAVILLGLAALGVLYALRHVGFHRHAEGT